MCNISCVQMSKQREQGKAEWAQIYIKKSTISSTQMHRQSCLKIVVIRRHSQFSLQWFSTSRLNERSRTLHAMECTPQAPVGCIWTDGKCYTWRGRHVRGVAARCASRGLINHTPHSRIFFISIFLRIFSIFYVFINLALKYGNNFKFASISFSGFQKNLISTTGNFITPTSIDKPSAARGAQRNLNV